MSSVIDELVVTLGVDVNAGAFENVRRMGEGLTQITTSAAKLGAGLSAAVTGFLFAVDKMASKGAELKKNADMIGLNTRAMQELGYVSTQAGGQMSDAMETYRNIVEVSKNIMPGQFNTVLFQRVASAQEFLKIINAPLEQRFDLIRDVLKKLPKEKLVDWARALGFQDPAIRMIEMPDSEYNRAKRGFATSGQMNTDEQLEKAKKVTIAIQNVWQQVESLGIAIAAVLEPALTELSKHPKVIDAITVALGAMTAVGVIGGIARLTAALAGFALGGIGALFSPGGLLMIGIAAFLVAIVAIATHWKEVKGIVIETATWFKMMGDQIIHYLEELGARFESWISGIESKLRAKHPWAAEIIYGHGMIPTDQDWIDFSNKGGYTPKGTMVQKEASLDPMIDWVAKYYGLPKALIQSMMQSESGFDPNATSPKGARGLMQLMPGTARDLGVSNSYDPFQNTMGGALYITQLIKIFHGNMQKVIEAYNAGLQNILRGRIPAETRRYLNDVLGNYQFWKQQNMRYPAREGKMGRSSTTTNNHITQHIHGNDAVEIATRVHKKTVLALQRTFPGGMAPAVA